MTAQFCMGLLALPALVVAVAVAWVIARWAFDGADRWLRERRPRAFRFPTQWDLFEHRVVELAKRRAALMAAIGSCESVWTSTPLPGITVLVIREYKHDEQTLAFTNTVRAAVADALGDLEVPQRPVAAKAVPPVPTNEDEEP